MNTPADNPIPDIPGWEIVDLLGRGGMGAVYRARSKTLSQLVALKVIDPLYASQPAFRQCFLREISTSVALHHAHILPILNFSPDPDSGLLFFVTPIVGDANCRSLADLIANNGKLDPGLAASLLAQVADALAYAHGLENPLIHRDVSPSNILLKTTRSGSYHALLADFGIAFPGTQEAREAVTDPDSLIPSAGKPQYMAPEQFDDVEFGPMTARTDLYQLGIVAYECLAGDLPYQETNPIRLSDCHRRAEVPRLTPEQCPDPRWRQLVTELLAKKPNDRPEDAATVRNRLFDIARQPQLDPQEPQSSETMPESQLAAASAPLAPESTAAVDTRPEAPSAPVPRQAPPSDPETPTDPLPTPTPPRTPRRPTPATVVQTARPTDAVPIATPSRPKRRIGRWILLLIGLLIPTAVLAFQFRASLFGSADDPAPIVRDGPTDPDDVGGVDSGGSDTTPRPPVDDADDTETEDLQDNEQNANDSGETEPHTDTDNHDDEASDESPTDPARPDDRMTDDAGDNSASNPAEFTKAPETYEKGPQQTRFEELLKEAGRNAGLADAEIDAMPQRDGTWALPLDTPHLALDQLLMQARGSFAMAKLARDDYEAVPQELTSAQTRWRDSEEGFARLIRHWRERQPRTLSIALSLRQERNEEGEPVGDREVLITLTKVGSDQPAARIPVEISSNPFYVISQTHDPLRPLIGPHYVKVTTIDGLHTFGLDPPGAAEVQDGVFDFGDQLPRFPGSDPVPTSSLLWPVVQPTEAELSLLQVRRAEIRIDSLESEVERLLIEGRGIYAEAVEKSQRAGEESDDDARGRILSVVNQLCVKWDNTIAAPINDAIKELESLWLDIAPLEQEIIDLNDVKSFIKDSEETLRTHNPTDARDAVVGELIKRRQSGNDEDDDG